MLIITNPFDINGQRWSQFSMSSLQPYRELAAYGGMDRQTSISMHVRGQWSELNGNPTTQYFGIHSPVYIWNGAVGADVMSQTQGNIGMRRLRASYNMVFPTPIGFISAGGRVGIIQASFDGERIVTPEGDYRDGRINHNDPELSNVLTNGVGASWELSTMLINARMAAGVSVGDLPAMDLNTGRTKVGQHPQINIFFRNFINLTERLDLQTSMMIKSDLNVWQGELSGLFKINGNIFGGLLLRGYSTNTIDALGVIFGHSLNERLSMFYSYDFGLNQLSTEHNGSHELVIKYTLNKLWGTGLPPRITYNPRFL